MTDAIMGGADRLVDADPTEDHLRRDVNAYHDGVATCPVVPAAKARSTNLEPDIATELLDSIEHPHALREFTESDLPQICSELRHELIRCVSQSGGHFGAGLGVVELTVALHFVYNTPDDRLIWDVGHQTYPHKILTGRRAQMQRIRQYGGLSGFPVRDESEYDAFGVAHAGTSVSAGLGMAAATTTAARHIVSVIGDGALTEGMVFEALNHAGASAFNITVVINDNAMSISPNVGALSAASTGDIAHKATPVERFVQSLGAHYSGPVDGHDVNTLVTQLQRIKQQPGVQVLHVITCKGKGYTPAEREPVKYHAVSSFDPDKGVVKAAVPSAPTYTSVFSDWICDSAADDDRVVAITPAMREGSGLVAFAKQFPARYHDVGIAEQHAVTFAAGLACEQMKPVVAIYSSFLQRAYDQLVHDVALQSLDVLFAIDRSGLVGADGATHHGSFDLSFLRCIPNLLLMAPADERECRLMLQTGLQHKGPAAVRYERGSGPGVTPDQTLATLPVGKAQLERTGRCRIALLTFGSMLAPALEAGDILDATVVNMRFIKPLDDTMLELLSDSHDLFVTVENNAVAGGAGSGVNEALARLGLSVNTLNLGLPDQFISHGSQQELLHELKLDGTGIVNQVHRHQQQTAARRKAQPRNAVATNSINKSDSDASHVDASHADESHVDESLVEKSCVEKSCIKTSGVNSSCDTRETTHS